MRWVNCSWNQYEKLPAQEILPECGADLHLGSYFTAIQGTQGVSATRSSGNRVCNRSKAVGMEGHAHAAQKCCSRLYRTAGVSGMMAVTYNNTVCWLRDNHLWCIRGLMTRFQIQMESADVPVLQRLVCAAWAGSDIGLTCETWRKCLWRWANSVVSGKVNGGMKCSSQRSCTCRSWSPMFLRRRHSHRLCGNVALEDDTCMKVAAAILWLPATKDILVENTVEICQEKRSQLSYFDRSELIPLKGSEGSYQSGATGCLIKQGRRMKPY